MQHRASFRHGGILLTFGFVVSFIGFCDGWVCKEGDRARVRVSTPVFSFAKTLSFDPRCQLLKMSDRSFNIEPVHKLMAFSNTSKLIKRGAKGNEWPS